MIVFDHHQTSETLPKALALVDPNREDDLSGLGYLSAAGVVFMALVALSRALREAGFWNGRSAPDLIAALDLVALATVADVVPLVGLNRAFVVKGLGVMRQRRRPGLAALFDVAGADGPPRPYHLGFLLGPRINAGGRIGDAALGVRLLTTADDLEARAIAFELDRLNRARQEIEIAALAEAEAEALLALGLEERGAAVVVVAGETWPPGVVGLIAARLKERFERPAFALTLMGGHATGSGRSIAGVDLGRAVRAAVETGIAIKGGGHAMAAGVTLASERLGEWRAFLEEKLAEAVARARAEAGLMVDAALTASAATPALAHRLEAAGPYGSGNPEPVFALPRHRLEEVTPVGADHLRLRAVAGDGQAVEANRVPRPGQEARRRARASPWRACASRRRAGGPPLRRAGAGAAQGCRCRGGGAVGAPRNAANFHGIHETLRGAIALSPFVAPGAPLPLIIGKRYGPIFATGGERTAPRPSGGEAPPDVRLAPTLIRRCAPPSPGGRREDRALYGPSAAGPRGKARGSESELQPSDSFALELLTCALPVLDVAAMRLAFLDPDQIGARLDGLLVKRLHFVALAGRGT